MVALKYTFKYADKIAKLLLGKCLVQSKVGWEIFMFEFRRKVFKYFPKPHLCGGDKKVLSPFICQKLFNLLRKTFSFSVRFQDTISSNTWIFCKSQIIFWTLLAQQRFFRRLIYAVVKSLHKSVYPKDFPVDELQSGFTYKSSLTQIICWPNAAAVSAFSYTQLTVLLL